MTTKDVNKGFYKGRGSGSMGRHTKKGGYIIEYHKVRTYVVPEGLKEFKVRAFHGLGQMSNGARVGLTLLCVR